MGFISSERLLTANSTVDQAQGTTGGTGGVFTRNALQGKCNIYCGYEKNLFHISLWMSIVVCSYFYLPIVKQK